MTTAKTEVSYEVFITLQHEGVIGVPNSVVSKGDSAVRAWLSENVFDEAKNYGDWDIRTVNWSIEK